MVENFENKTVGGNQIIKILQNIIVIYINQRNDFNVTNKATCSAIWIVCE
jgi:hypothetical protein